MTQPRGTGGRSPVFLERTLYRRRRLADALRLLPLAGAVLFLLPLLWPDPGPGEDGVPMSRAIIYIFSVWAGLIVAAIAFAVATRRWKSGQGPQRPGQD